MDFRAELLVAMDYASPLLWMTGVIIRVINIHNRVFAKYHFTKVFPLSKSRIQPYLIHLLLVKSQLLDLSIGKNPK